MGRPKSGAGIQSISQPPLMPRTTNPVSTTPGSSSSASSESPAATPLHDINLAPTQSAISVNDAYPLSLSVPDMMFLDSISHDDIGDQHGIAYSVFQSQFPDSTYESITLPFTNGLSKGALQRENSYLDRQMSPPLIESDHQVLQFNLKLAKRLQQCQSFFRRNDNHRKEGSATASEPLIADKDDMRDQEANPFGRILSDTSEFLTIIQAYTSHHCHKFTEPRMRGRGCSNASHDFGTSVTSRPCLILVLSLISAYLQLVLIYEELFSFLNKKLLSGYTGAALDLQIFPQLQLAGFSVQQGNLQRKIFIQTTIHQFEMIEKALGLPPDLRVTNTQDVYMGFLEDENTKRILTAISGGKLYPQASGEYEGLRALTSLREHLKRIWTLSEA
ncbi:hypothetical protein EYB25_008756 [Talaromyces marneffei]|nr:hypothetical protein EYB25_008756 [Talaromyces marneffei]